MGWLGCILQHTCIQTPPPPFTHTHTGIQTPPSLCVSLLMVHLPPCFRGQLNSSIKGAELFPYQKLIQHLSPSFILGTQRTVHCVTVNAKAECVYGSMEEGVCLWEKETVCVSERSRTKKKKGIVWAWLFCVGTGEQTYGDYEADWILFSGNRVSKDVSGSSWGLHYARVRLAAIQRAAELLFYSKCCWLQLLKVYLW